MKGVNCKEQREKEWELWQKGLGWGEGTKKIVSERIGKCEWTKEAGKKGEWG